MAEVINTRKIRVKQGNSPVTAPVSDGSNLGEMKWVIDTKKLYIDNKSENYLINQVLTSDFERANAGAGLKADGTYSADSTTNYLKSASSLANADKLLDTNLKTVSGEVDTVEKSAGLNSSGVYTANTSMKYIGSVTSLTKADEALDGKLYTVSGELDTVETSVGLTSTGGYTPNTNSNYIGGVSTLVAADNALDANLKTVSGKTDNVQAELDKTQTGAGLNNDGTYTKPATSNYLSSAASLKDADSELDSAIKTLSDNSNSGLTAIKTAVGLNADGTYSKVTTGKYISGATTVKDATSKLDVAISGVQTELDTTQSGAGLSSTGAYVKNTTANYISTASTLNAADVLLDSQLKTTNDTLSSHTSNTTVHITATERSTWNAKQNAIALKTVNGLVVSGATGTTEDVPTGTLTGITLSVNTSSLSGGSTVSRTSGGTTAGTLNVGVNSGYTIPSNTFTAATVTALSTSDGDVVTGYTKSSNTLTLNKSSLKTVNGSSLLGSGNVEVKRVLGVYTGNGGQQPPNYFGSGYTGFLMSDLPLNDNYSYKSIIYLDPYHYNDAGGTNALAITRVGDLRAWIMQSGSDRDTWTTTAELISTANYSSYAQPLDADLTAIAGITTTSGWLRKTAANTWSLGTPVTSVAISGGTGLSVGGTPITSTGTLTVAAASGREIPTTTDMNKARSAVTSVTTTAGTTGATTFVSDVSAVSSNSVTVTTQPLYEVYTTEAEAKTASQSATAKLCFFPA
jgi:hypothetical protein